MGTSPGVVELEGSFTEYYRTVGAIIALLACYATANGDDFGLEAVSAGERGPMSMDKPPGKFINLGTKPDQYKTFCEKFAEGMKTEEDWWAMIVFLAVHDVGKADNFRNMVNKTLPKNKQTDDHDRVLSVALQDPELRARSPECTEIESKAHSGDQRRVRHEFSAPAIGPRRDCMQKLSWLDGDA